MVCQICWRTYWSHWEFKSWHLTIHTKFHWFVKRTVHQRTGKQTIELNLRWNVSFLALIYHPKIPKRARQTENTDVIGQTNSKCRTVAPCSITTIMMGRMYVMLITPMWKNSGSITACRGLRSTNWFVCLWIVTGSLRLLPQNPIMWCDKSFVHRKSKFLVFCIAWGKDVASG